ncbi:unnamed protein product [Leuciscus chuanchicus]
MGKVYLFYETQGGLLEAFANLGKPTPWQYLLTKPDPSGRRLSTVAFNPHAQSRLTAMVAVGPEPQRPQLRSEHSGALSDLSSSYPHLRVTQLGSSTERQSLDSPMEGEEQEKINGLQQLK